MEVFDDSDKVGADIALLHGCPQSCMSNPVEGLLEVYEDMGEVLLVLETFQILNLRILCEKYVYTDTQTHTQTQTHTHTHTHAQITLK